MGPKNIAQILARLKTKMGGSLPSDFITWLEIIIGGEKDLLACQYKYVLLRLINLYTFNVLATAIITGTHTSTSK